MAAKVDLSGHKCTERQERSSILYNLAPESTAYHSVSQTLAYVRTPCRGLAKAHISGAHLQNSDGMKPGNLHFYNFIGDADAAGPAPGL